MYCLHYSKRWLIWKMLQNLHVLIDKISICLFYGFCPYFIIKGEYCKQSKMCSVEKTDIQTDRKNGRWNFNNKCIVFSILLKSIQHELKRYINTCMMNTLDEKITTRVILREAEKLLDGFFCSSWIDLATNGSDIDSSWSQLLHSMNNLIINVVPIH